MLAPVTQLDMQRRAEALSQARETLSELLRVMNAEIETIKQGSIAQIRAAGRKVAAEHNKLAELIAAHPDLFDRPRTHVVAGLKYGLQKQRGRMSWTCDTKLCERIHALTASGDLTAEQEALLINTTEKPVAKALEKLDAKLLKRLGVTVAADTDEVLIKSVDGEVEKAVNAIIKDITKDGNAEVSL